jgi:hypothetical protein
MTDQTQQAMEREAFEAAYRKRYRVPAHVPLTFPDVEPAWEWWLAAALSPAAPAVGAPVPEGRALVPDYRGYARLGTGQYVLNNSANDGEEPELIISIATEEEKAGRTVGEMRDNPPGRMLQPEEMCVRIRFASVAGLDALENQLRLLREECFGSPPAASAEVVTGVDERDMCRMVGVRSDGTEVDLGAMPMPPLMKAKDIVRSYFGGNGFDDEMSDDALALQCCREVIDYMNKAAPPAASLREQEADDEAEYREYADRPAEHSDGFNKDESALHHAYFAGLRKGREAPDSEPSAYREWLGKVGGGWRYYDEYDGLPAGGVDSRHQPLYASANVEGRGEPDAVAVMYPLPNGRWDVKIVEWAERPKTGVGYQLGKRYLAIDAQRLGREKEQG